MRPSSRNAWIAPMPSIKPVRASEIGLRERTVSLAITWICRAGKRLP